MRKRKSRRGSSYLCQRKVTVRRQRIREISGDLQLFSPFQVLEWAFSSHVCYGIAITVYSVLNSGSFITFFKCSSQQSIKTILTSKQCCVNLAVVLRPKGQRK